MAKAFRTSQLLVKLENMMKLEKLQQEKVMIILLVIYWTISTLKITTN